jgi:ParB-like nuclease domain
MHITTVRLDQLTIDPEIQARAALDQDAVEDYAEAMRQGVKFPPLEAVDDLHQLLLWRGFHRYEAAKLAGLTEIEVSIDEGTKDAAILMAVGDNSDHGVRRTPADKRRAVGILLARPEWAKWTDREIARQCNVSPTLVGKVRAATLTIHVDSENPAGERPRTYTTKHGTEAVMNTERIGKGPAPVSASKPKKEQAKVDGIGLPIPPELAKTFEALDRFDHMYDAYRSIAQLFNRIATSKGGEVFRSRLKPMTHDGVEVFHCTDLGNSLRHLKAAAPFAAICPACHFIHPGRKDTECKSCRGVGWITENVWERSLPEHRAAVLALVGKAAA